MVPMAVAAPSSFFWPMQLPMSTVPPMDRDKISMVTVLMIWEPMDTPETAAAPAYWPTTNRSAAPYSDCSRLDNIKGSANRTSVGATLPSVNEKAFITDFQTFLPVAFRAKI